MSENVQTFSGKVNVADNLLVGTSHFFVDRQNNRVGIGTSTPDASSMLDVTGNIKSGGTITATGGFSGNGSGLSGVNSDSGSWVNGSSSNIHLAVSTDKVGIGVVSPGAELHVGGTGAIIVPSGTTGDRPATAANGMFRYNTETGYMESYTASGWGSIATPPTIQTISPASVAVADVTTQVFTVTGTFFDAQSAIKLQGADNTLYDTTDFVFTNSGSIGFKMGTLATGQAANRPFKVVVTNGAGLIVTSTATIGFTPIWTSPAAGATLATFATNASANNTELAATDDVGGSAVTFPVPAANLPSGLTLNGSTGAITGTIGAAGTTSVTFRATDNASGTFAERTFSIVGALVPIGQQTFTTPGTTTWVAPTGVTSVSVVCVGGGGGGEGSLAQGGAGGGLAWRNNVSVTPGTSYTVTVGAGGNGRRGVSNHDLPGSDTNVTSNSAGAAASNYNPPGGNGGTSSFLSTSAGGGQHGGGTNYQSSRPLGGTFTGDGGGNGGSCEGNRSGPWSTSQSSGGGGAGGYSGTGGKGGGSLASEGSYVAATAGAGGGGGGGGSRKISYSNSSSSYGGAGGGGVGLLGQGANGVAGYKDTSAPYSSQVSTNVAGGGGSGGARGNLSTTTIGVGGAGGLYGGGGGPAATSNLVNGQYQQYGGDGGNGAVRIIWGPGRSFPTNAA